jgi:hypothetical protein
VTATYTRTAGEAVGTYTISATLSPAAVLTNYNIVSNTAVFTITPAATVTTITSHVPHPSIRGQLVTVGFSVAPQFTGTPSGNVTVTASTGESCTAALNGGGAGTCTLLFNTGGIRDLAAAYSGDANFQPSTSAPVSHIVTAVNLSTTSLLYGNQLVGTTSASQSVTLTNVGTTGLGIISLTYTGDFIDSTNCPVGGTLQAGNSCRVNVRFRPTAIGIRLGTLQIATNDPGVPLATVSLTGTAIAPVNTLSPAPPATLTFSSPMNVTSAAQPVTVTNTGTAPLIISSIRLSGTNSSQFGQSNNCPIGGAGLAPANSCTINVTFRPTSSTPLTKVALLNVNVQGPATSAQLNLTGSIIVPTFTLSQNALNFGTVVRPGSSTLSVTLTNGPNAPLVITSIPIQGANPSQFSQVDSCAPFPATLPANGICTINVTFRPTSAGTKNAILTVRVAAPATNQTVSLTGVGQ